jgi:hypothetical protein
MWTIIRQDELYHHGILGMHWGKQNGPPYPLGSGDHSASEKKAGWRKSLKTQKSNYKTLKKYRPATNRELISGKRGPNDLRNITTNMAKNMSGEQAKKWIDAEKRLEKANKASIEDYNTYPGLKAHDEAYKKVLNEYKKKDPESLKRMIKENGGRDWDLDEYSIEFGKLVDQEYFERTSGSKFEKIVDAWDAKHRVKSDEYFSALDNLLEQRKAVASEVLGKYANKKVKTFLQNKDNTKTYKELVSNTIDWDELQKEYSKK